MSLLAVLDGVLNGREAPLVPIPAADPRAYERLTGALRVGHEIDDDIALVMSTSGTTGTPKGAMLTPAALIAGASATHDRLGGPGTWLLALPTYHIAGMQILVRSLLAGTVPMELDISAGFDVTDIPAAVAQMGGGRRYASLVAAQLSKALSDPDAAAALSELDAVLLGGGPAPPPVLDAAAIAGIAVVRSYGSSETAGGCVYDGVPLDGVFVRVEGATADGVGRITIGGATLAKGYRNPPEPDPFADPGWFHTDDIGTVDDSGRLRVMGRSDDAISTGGLTVMPGVVEAVLAGHPAVADIAVFGVPDDRLGEQVVAAIVLTPESAAPAIGELKAVVAQSLDATAAPRALIVVDALPRRGIGKVDRRALRQIYGSVSP